LKKPARNVRSDAEVLPSFFLKYSLLWPVFHEFKRNFNENVANHQFFVKFAIIFTISLRKTSKPVFFGSFLPVSAVFYQKMMIQTVLILDSFRRF
jgi:hypothetical protein